MKEDKKWMLMTYYCPTHGDLGRIEPIEMKRDEILEVLSKKMTLRNNLKSLNQKNFNSNT